MNHMRRVILGGCLMGLALGMAGPALAGVFEDTVRGLEYAGFTFAGSRNPLSGGADFSLSRNFNNETLDFGASELTLTGPLDLTFSTGGRTLPVLDFSLNTGGQAFDYVFKSSSGAQDLRIEGNFLLDATGSMNTFGFYDMRFQLSSRQNVFLDGRFQDNVDRNLDFDIGPIDVSGNIFADALARVFDPVFEATGTENIFDSFSGRTQRETLLQDMVAAAQTKLAQGQKLTDEDVAKLLGYSSAYGMLGDEVPDLAFLSDAYANNLVTPSTVPEPGVLALLLGATVCAAARRRR
jgi:hypothetical protein